MNPIPSSLPPQAPIPGEEEMPPMGDMGGEQPDMGQPEDDTNAFGKEKFDAGIDVDENADPKNYIEKLTGKLAQKLRDFNGTQDDVDLNKFVINSLIPAAIPQMDDNEAKDVIKKVQDNIGKSGQESGQNSDLGNDNQTDNEVPQEIPNQDSGQPFPQEENKDFEIDDLINEILSGKGVKRNVKNKNPFNGKKFK